MPAFPRPKYPDCLTSKNWERNKGLVAKMAGETGVGASLKKLEMLYKSTFEAVDLMNNKPPINTFKLALWDKTRDDALKFAVRECQDLRQAATSAGKLAADTAAKFAKSKVISKDSTALCKEMEKAAEKLAAECDPAKVKTYIETTYKEGRAWLDVTVQLVTNGSLPKTCTEIENLLQNLDTPPDWKKKNIKSKTRQVTQVLGNAVKVANAGYPLKINAKQTKELFDRLTLYADTSDQPFADDDIKGFNEHRRTLSKLLTVAAKVS